MGDRLVTVLLTVVVPEAADPGDAAAPVADAAVSSVLDIGPAVGVQGHLPVAGGTVGPIRTGQPAAVLVVGGRAASYCAIWTEPCSRCHLGHWAPVDPADTHPGLVSQDAP